MAFNDDEKSAASGQPVELFKFTGTFNTWYLTSSAVDFINTEATWISEFIERKSIAYASQEEQSVALSITLPFDHPMVTQYAFLESPPRLMCEVQRVHPLNPNDTVLQWTGEVISWQIEGRTANLTVPTLFNYVFRNPCPAVKYQAPCNHVLYDERCGVADTAFRSDQTVLSISGTDIVLDANPFADGDCDAGEIFTASGERRMIIGNTGTSFQISSPFSNLSVNDTVTIRQGCNHTFTTCKNKFNNGDNFGGFPFVPNRNPYSSRL